MDVTEPLLAEAEDGVTAGSAAPGVPSLVHATRALLSPARTMMATEGIFGMPVILAAWLNVSQPVFIARDATGLRYGRTPT